MSMINNTNLTMDMFTRYLCAFKDSCYLCVIKFLRQNNF